MCLVLCGAFSVFVPLRLKPWQITEGIWSSVLYRFCWPGAAAVKTGSLWCYFVLLWRGPPTYLKLCWGKVILRRDFWAGFLTSHPPQHSLTRWSLQENDRVHEQLPCSLGPISGTQGVQDSTSQLLLPFPQSCRGSHGSRLHISGYSRKQRGGMASAKPAPPIRTTKAFLEAPSKLFTSHLPPLSIRETMKLFHLSSLFRGGEEGALRADVGRHPVLCARNPFQLGHPVSLKGQPLLMAHWGRSTWVQPFTGWYQLHIFCILNHIKHWIILNTSIFLFHSFLE